MFLAKRPIALLVATVASCGARDLAAYMRPKPQTLVDQQAR